jgi:hypothetical protein
MQQFVYGEIHTEFLLEIKKKTTWHKKNKITQASNVDLHIEAGQDQEKKQTINRLVATN